MNFLKAICVVIVVACLALACSGCTVKIENFTQNNTTQRATLFDVPEYPNANRTSYSTIPFVGHVATYETNATAQQVLEFYNSQMQDRGYNVRSFTGTNETGGVVIFAKEPNTVWVAIGQNANMTNIAVRTSF